MAKTISNRRVWLDGYNISADVSAFSYEYGSEPQDVTTYDETTRINLGGLRTAAFALEGFSRAGSSNIDEVAWGKVGSSNSIVTVASTAGAGVGGRAYFGRQVVTSFTPVQGSVGDAATISLQGLADDELVHGWILHNSSGITATGNGTFVTLPAVAATETLYGALHVTENVGSTNTIDVVVGSDSSTAAASVVTRLTFAQQTANGSNWQSLAGAQADVVYRVTHTVAGATADFNYALVIGIKG